MDVGHSCQLFLVSDDLNLLFRDVVFLQKALNVVSCEVGGGIVDDDNMVICVILIEDALQVVLISKIFGVVVGGDDDTERQFLLIFAQMKVLF